MGLETPGDPLEDVALFLAPAWKHSPIPVTLQKLVSNPHIPEPVYEWTRGDIVAALAVRNNRFLFSARSGDKPWRAFGPITIFEDPPATTTRALQLATNAINKTLWY